MSFDFSFLRSIDFTSNDNILFLLILLFVLIIVCFIFIEVLAESVKIIKKIILRLFKQGANKNNFDKNETAELPVQLQSVVQSKKEDGILKKKNSNVGVALEMGANVKKPEERKKETAESHKEAEQKDIEGSLEAIKAEGSKDLKRKDTLESKMPSRTENPEKENNHETIRIPRKKIVGGDSLPGRSNGEAEHKEIEVPVASKIHDRLLFYDKDRIKAVADTAHGGIVEKTIGGMAGLAGNPIPTANQGEQGGIMFEGKPEVSRKELRRELRKDPKIWQVNRDMRLNLSRSERANLVKEVIPNAYGRIISKNELKRSVKKLYRKMKSTGNLQDRTKMRREVKFFKKIGGIT